MITPTNRVLGPQRYDRESAQLLTRPGVAAGLAWTQTGGEILYVEASRMRAGTDGRTGSGHMTLTGQLGDVMKESAQLAVSWLRSNADELRIGDGGMLGLIDCSTATDGRSTARLSLFSS